MTVQPYEEPTPEMRRWAARLAPTLAPGSWVGTALVTPIAHVANASLDFQMYLYDVFHRGWIARAGHRVCMPGIIVSALASLALLGSWLAAAAGGALAVWYLRLGRREGLPLVGWVSAATAVGGVVAAVVWANSAGGLDPREALLALVVLQTLSHATEPDVPPRVSGEPRWRPIGAWFREAPVRNLVRSTLMAVAGVVNEAWASWRLFPLLVLDGLWRVGYAPSRRVLHEERVAAALATGNPAIDVIGAGGACERGYP